MLTALVTSIWMLGVATPATARPLFSDPLDGSAPRSAWRTPPSTFTDLPEGGRALRFGRGTTWASTGQPWVGDESWSSYRIEVEVRPEKMWGGVDFHVSNDGRTGYEVTVIEGGDKLFVEASGLWDLASAWKLWPVGQRTIPHAAGSWVRLRIDVGPGLANVFANDDPQPVATFRDIPFSRGGVRLAAYAGSALFRNLRVTALPEGSVTPALDEDPWGPVRHQQVLRSWKVTPRQGPGFGAEGLPPEVTLSWVDAPVDGRGVVNLTPLVGPEATPGVAFAKAEIRAAAAGPLRAWVTYTDNLALWCNGRLIFQGPPRQWFHPDREKNGNSRLIPDQYEVTLPLAAGANEVLVRSEVTEATFGWGFWMRVE
jgi:hypothetical protein